MYLVSLINFFYEAKIFYLATPRNAVISGPEVIHHEKEFTYECAVDGGNPAPEITWTVSDQLGQTKEQKGELIGEGLSRMMLKTGSEERMLTINCVGENTQGRVSHTKHVHTHCKLQLLTFIYNS